MVVKGLIIALVALALGSGGLFLWQWGKIKSLEADLSSCGEDKAAAELSVENLKTAIETQNRELTAAETLSRTLSHQKDLARAKLAETEEAHNRDLARLRREQAAADSCEETRQKLITEATGHEFP